MHSRPAHVLLVATVALAGCAHERDNVLHVIAERAPGLQRSARVQYRGVEVGRVKEVYFTTGGVRIDVLLDRADVPIRTRDTVRIVPAGPFGAAVVDIQPGEQSAPLIAHGATLPRVQPESTVALPVSAWRAMVRALGIEGAAADSVAAASAAADSTARR